MISSVDSSGEHVPQVVTQAVNQKKVREQHNKLKRIEAATPFMVQNPSF